MTYDGLFALALDSVVFNVSNRYLDIVPLLANLAADAGLVCLSRYDAADTERDEKVGRYASRFLVMARQLRDIQRLDYDPEWKEVPTDPRLGVWTDQCTNIFGLLKWQ